MSATDPRLIQIFQSALEHDTGAREAFLAAACAGDAALLEEVRRLIASDREAEKADFWRSSAMELEAASWAAADDRIGQVVGRYKILEAISSGGMGTVYRAARADAEYQQHVAVKIIKRGMDTGSIIRRFRTERQILARLEHPNIARLLDGGTTPDGLPYLVMEYVEGLPVDAYAQTRKLDARRVLQLFQTICAAVEYAHRNLVIHRDIKPGNILISEDKDGQPVPKLLDFGIAKLLDGEESSGATQTLNSFLTPEYASPEHVRGEPMNTASDVYSLGVLLYKLLTGQSPYRVRSRRPQDLASAICTEQPEPPSVASRAGSVSGEGGGKPHFALRGDLDNIVLMALRKEPDRRYASVGLFAEDIRRYLEGLPILAHPDSLGYRARKFVRRHAIYVSAAALLCVTLTAGVVTTLWEARVAQLERARAERRFQDVRKLANSLLFELHDSLTGVPGTLAARQLIVKRGLEYLDSLESEAGDDRALKTELAVAYDRVASLTFDVRTALQAHRRALALNQSLVKSDPGNPKYASQLATSYEQVGWALRDRGDSLGALEASKAATVTMEQLVRLDPLNENYRVDQARMYETLGINVSRVGGYQEARDAQQKALAINQALMNAHPDGVTYRQAVLESYVYLGRALLDQHDFAGALEAGRKALQMGEAAAAAAGNDPMFRRNLWLAHLRIGEALENLGRYAEAAGDFAKGLEVIQEISDADPGDTGNRRGVAWTLMAMAKLEARMRLTQQAIGTDMRAIAISTQLLQADPEKLETTIDLGNMYGQLASARQALGDSAGAAEAREKARGFFAAAAARDPANAMVKRGQEGLGR